MENKYHYHRPYCENCKLIYSALSTGLILNCSKCQRPLTFKSFNPWPKTIGGILIFLFAMFILLMGVPIIWIGGFIWGISLMISGHTQWSKIKNLDTKIVQKTNRDGDLDKENVEDAKIIKDVRHDNSYCSNCGAKIEEDLRFCIKCGNKILDS